MKNIIWEPGLGFAFTRPFTLRATGRRFGEGDIDPIQAWCQETGIGKRTSFDTFAFRNETDMSMFLLQWNNHEPKIDDWDLF